MDFGFGTQKGSEPYGLSESLDFGKGQSQLVADAWKKHESDRLRVSRSPREIYEVMEVEYFKEMGKYLNEVFLSAVDLDFDRRQKTPGVFLSEVFTHTQRVMNEAKKRGHKVGTAVVSQGLSHLSGNSPHPITKHKTKKS